MFARIKKSGKYDYLQIVENQRVNSKVTQRVIATVGRMDKLSAKGEVESLIRSLSRFSEKALLVLSGKSDIQCEAKTIGPAIIFERLWCELGIQQVIKDLLHITRLSCSMWNEPSSSPCCKGQRPYRSRQGQGGGEVRWEVGPHHQHQLVFGSGGP